ncbi:hypothetical protein B0J11DRAFT_338093 [Dendryphion nanum]|uniref:F-box domain-containing protein n=1 Tax=Dendryphion nanum TaxID=256645 RepID=A0A9P9DNX1_9PLEO|nr:hypothetical protein B0J11DRAFT_338093 [Dendryphion nanum]
MNHLPIEVIEMIAGDLSIEDLHSFRLACRDFKAKAQVPFFDAHYGISSFMVTRDSLQTLVNFSKHDTKRKRIREIRICLVTFTDSHRARITEDPLSKQEMNEYNALLAVPARQARDSLDSSTESFVTAEEDQGRAFQRLLEEYLKKLKRSRRRNYGRHMSQQFALRRSGTDISMLTEALKNLPALETISITDEFDPECPTWGARQLQIETGIIPTTGKPDPVHWWYNPTDVAVHLDMRRHVFALVMGAVARSQVKLKHFSIQGVPYRMDYPKTPTSRRLSPAGTPATTFAESSIPGMQPLFVNLQSLTLTIFENRYNDPAIDAVDTPLDWISKFAPAFENLRKLSIIGHKGNPHEETHIVNTLSPANVFPNLLYFALEIVPFNVVDLCRFINNHSLEGLTIYDCTCLEADPYHPFHSYGRVLETLKNTTTMCCLKLQNPPQPDLWATTGLGRQFQARLLLPGIGTNSFIVEASDPCAFQIALQDRRESLNIN